jgi:hypothetical protein
VDDVVKIKRLNGLPLIVIPTPRESADGSAAALGDP